MTRNEFEIRFTQARQFVHVYYKGKWCNAIAEQLQNVITYTYENDTSTCLLSECIDNVEIPEAFNDSPCQCLLKLTNGERNDILFALRLWVRDYRIKMGKQSVIRLEDLTDKIDYVGGE